MYLAEEPCTYVLFLYVPIGGILYVPCIEQPLFRRWTLCLRGRGTNPEQYLVEGSDEEPGEQGQDHARDQLQQKRTNCSRQGSIQ